MKKTIHQTKNGFQQLCAPETELRATRVSVHLSSDHCFTHRLRCYTDHGRSGCPVLCVGTQLTDYRANKRAHQVLNVDRKYLMITKITSCMSISKTILNQGQLSCVYSCCSCISPTCTGTAHPEPGPHNQYHLLKVHWGR